MNSQLYMKVMNNRVNTQDDGLWYNLKKTEKPGMIVNAFNSSTQEADL